MLMMLSEQSNKVVYAVSGLTDGCVHTTMALDVCLNGLGDDA